MNARVCFRATLTVLVATTAWGALAADDGQVDYFPFKQGSRWLYDAKVNGRAVSMKILISNIQSGPERQAAEFESVVNGKVTATEFVGKSSEGPFRLRMNGNDITPPLQLLRIPVTKGDIWNTAARIAGEPMNAHSFVDVQQVVVPAGTFDAVVVTTEATSREGKIVNKQWFAPGIGPVKQEAKIMGVSITAELKRYDPGR